MEKTYYHSPRVRFPPLRYQLFRPLDIQRHFADLCLSILGSAKSVRYARNAAQILSLQRRHDALFYPDTGSFLGEPRLGRRRDRQGWWHGPGRGATYRLDGIDAPELDQI